MGAIVLRRPEVVALVNVTLATVLRGTVEQVGPEETLLFVPTGVEAEPDGLSSSKSRSMTPPPRSSESLSSSSLTKAAKRFFGKLAILPFRSGAILNEKV